LATRCSCDRRQSLERRSASSWSTTWPPPTFGCQPRDPRGVVGVPSEAQIRAVADRLK